MKKILVFIFILTFLVSCQLGTSKTALIADNFKKNSKKEVTFSGKANNGICINCSQ